MTEPVAHIYKDDERVLQLENEALVKHFENSETYRVEKV